MYRLIESIKLQNGNFHRLHYHQARVDRSLNELYKIKSAINLPESLARHGHPQSGLYKCRVIYEKQVEAIEFIPYLPAPIVTLKIVHDPGIDYTHKFENRSRLESLFQRRQHCDDILIIKNGFVTDSSYSNIIFFDGTKWVTPDTPLLKGTMRQFLLDAAEIKAVRIQAGDISSFKYFRLINAMVGFDGPEIDVSKIVL